ncbi:MAG: type III pantothenate kinase [Bacteroidetes bacterium]|nr:type III pantothenate kinase [Bacteroidota bacterium]
MTTLCLDFGNSRRKAAIFKEDRFIEEILLTDDLVGSVASIIQQQQPQRSILSSVINHDEKVEQLLSATTKFHKLGTQTTLNFTIAVGKPETVGADRLALSAAAAHFFPGMNNLVIGLGTCITYNFINQYQQFLGGSISPGMDMRFRCMHEYTAKLPLVQPTFTLPLIGYDTKTNIQSGVVYGMCCEIDGYIEKYGEKYGNFNVVLTGGNSAHFASLLKNKIFADHNFLYKGLYALSELNN